LIDEVADETARAQLHACVDALPEAEVSGALDRMLMSRVLDPEWFTSTERDHGGRDDGGPTARPVVDDPHDDRGRTRGLAESVTDD